MESFLSIGIWFAFRSNAGADVSEILGAAMKNSEISYSSNAKNFGRLASGDSSAGSVYDKYPKSPAASKRRAMQGCRIESARNEAGDRDSS